MTNLRKMLKLAGGPLLWLFWCVSVCEKTQLLMIDILILCERAHLLCHHFSAQFFSEHHHHQPARSSGRKRKGKSSINRHHKFVQFNKQQHYKAAKFRSKHSLDTVSYKRYQVSRRAPHSVAGGGGWLKKREN